MIYLNKILPILVSPIFLVVALILFGLWRKRARYVLFAIAVLWSASTPLVADFMTRWIEDDRVRVSVSNVRSASAIIVLGGMTTTVRADSGFATEWLDPDRFFAGVELFKAGKAPILIFSRGKLPWQSAAIPEGEFLKDVAIEMGIAPQNILLTGEVNNTSGEAREVRKLLQEQPSPDIILVTSAFHMTRAQALFERNGFSIQPFPVDQKSMVQDFTILSLLPRAGPLLRTSIAVREWVGQQYYALRATLGL